MPEHQPRVVLGADPLFQPATGIGNYTRPLASNLLELQLIEALTLYANGVVLPGERLASIIDPPLESAPGQGSHRTSASSAGLLSTLRGSLACGLGPQGIPNLMPVLDRVRLHAYRDAVFHSPTISCRLLRDPRWSRFTTYLYSVIPSTTPLSGCVSWMRA